MTPTTNPTPQETLTEETARLAERVRVLEGAIREIDMMPYYSGEIPETQIEGLRARYHKALDIARAHTPPTRGREMSEKVNYLTVSENASLKLAAEAIDRAFPDALGIYHVGSSITRKDYRDVDVRLILHDADFERVFGKTDAHPECMDMWFLFCWAVSEWMQKRTGLPVDFQIQSMTEANKPSNKGPRNGLFFAYPEQAA